MKYVIYGTNRVAKDFLYVFDDLDIYGVISDGNFDTDIFEGYPIYDIEYISSHKEQYDKIILCDFDKSYKIKVMEKYGFTYFSDYIYEEDLFKDLDEIKLTSESKILIWGTGKIAKEYSEEWMKDYSVVGFIDSNKNKETCFEKPVYLPEEITDWSKYFVIVAVVKGASIYEYLQNKGLVNNINYASYEAMDRIPSKLLKQTIFDKAYYDLECDTMHNHIEILRDGTTRCCCTTFVKHNLDNMMEKSVEQVWKSKLHKIMCLSLENRTYTFCDKTMCPLFIGKKALKKTVTHEYEKMQDAPQVMSLGFDGTCNLSCITCRDTLHVACGKESDKLMEISKKLEDEYLDKCKFIILAGNGEVFASKAYKYVYTSPKCKPKYMRILSNGLLFNEKNWAEITKDKTCKVMLTVSVDAATKATYEKIRRNGNFDILRNNMEFAAKLRKSGELSYFRMNFVVQKENYMEMPLFVEWGKELGLDEVFFTKILNWGTYTDKEFKEISMMEENGITPKPELKEILDSPIMQESIVDMGTIQYSHKEDKIDVVENYYMWELEKRGGKLFG